MSVRRLVVVLCVAILVSPDGTFLRQRNVKGDAFLCKTGTPVNITSSRSSLECLAKCWNLLGGLCKSVKYLKGERTCSHFDDVMTYDFLTDANDRCLGYQVKRECPNGFKFVTEGNKCWKFHGTLSTWYDARTACRTDNPLSYLAVVDSIEEINLVSAFASMRTKEPNMWTSGFSSCVSLARQPYYWLVAGDGKRPMSPSAPWNAGEPNSGNDGTDSCVEMYMSWRLNDDACSGLRCFVCEV